MRTLTRLRPARETVIRRPWPGRILAAIAFCVPLLSGCGQPAAAPLPPVPSPAAPSSLAPSASFPASSLTVETDPRQIECSPAPNPAMGAPHWNSPIGFSRAMFYNRSHQPLTVQSVSLLDPHNLVLHQAMVYDMVRASNPLPLEWAWTSGPGPGLAGRWAARQPVPGAVIPAEDGPLSAAAIYVRRPGLYEITVDLSAASRAGGWALGEIVRYRAGGATRTLTFAVGMAIGGADRPIDSACDAPMGKIAAIWHQTLK